MNNKTENILKNKLDSLLEKYQAQPVGNGYIDIIIKREKFINFAEEILKNGFSISDISWWEYVDSMEKKNKYGLGGPLSRFFEGWFSEIPISLDKINTNDTVDNQLKEIIRVIENKEIQFADEEKITFKQNHLLTPAFWLTVPDSWRNKFKE